MRKLRMGMVGGGQGAFIGQIHRMASALDGQIELVCGAFNQSADRSKQSGAALGLPDQRCYSSYQEMLDAEAAMPAAIRMDFVTIVTPNVSHAAIACRALERGFHVFCEKPATFSLSECQQLSEIHQANNQKFALAYVYAGYPMMVEARQRIRDGEIGVIQKVVVDYSQGWLAEFLLPAEQKQAQWRLDPAQVGSSCCIGDIGVHAAHLAEFVTGQQIDSVLADLGRVGQGRQLDDDGTVLLRFSNGARGVLNASQICVAEENNLTLRVYGSSGNLQWSQQDPNTLTLYQTDRPGQILRPGHGYLCPEALAVCRTPPGHPEGFIEAFANLYHWFCHSIHTQPSGAALHPLMAGMEQGLRGMALIEATVRSEQLGNRWVSVDAVLHNEHEGMR